MSTYHPYGFVPGQEYPLVKDASPQDYLDAVLEAERFLTSQQITDEEGTRWRTADGGQKVELYEGAAGIAYFYLRFYQATGEARYAEIVKDAARYLQSHWKDSLGSTIFPMEGDRPDLDLRYCIYRGIGSSAWLLLEAYKEFHDPSYAKTAREIIDYYKDHAQYDENGDIYWYSRPSIYLDGGIILLLIDYDRTLHDDEVRELAESAGRHYRTLGDDDGQGGLFFNGLKGFMDVSWQNMEFGSPGSAFILSILHRYTGDDEYSRIAELAMNHVRQVAVPVGDGELIPFIIDNATGEPLRGEDGKPICYLGWCNGIVGMSLCYYGMYLDTHDERYLNQIDRLADAYESLGAPEHQSTGLWNSVCYCCGHAGMLQHFVSLTVTTGNPRWERLAERTASVLLGTKEDLGDGASDWPVAWERLRPEHLTRSPGYFDGTAGIASSLLQLYLLKTRGRKGFHWSRLIDDPYPEEAPAE